MTKTDAPFDEQLAAVLGEPMTSIERDALDRRLSVAFTQAHIRSRRHRFPLRRGALIAAALLLLVPVFVTAGAAIITSEDPFGLENAQAYQAEIDAAKAQVPLPSGRAWPAHLRAQDPSGSYSRGGGRASVETNAVCIWFDEWLDARQAGDDDRASAAARVIALVPTWPSWTSGFWTQSVRDHLLPLIAAVAAAKERPIRDEIGLNCDWLAGP